MMKRAAIYARVSTTNGQTPSNQIGRLREVAEKAGWEIVEEFVDRGISGAKGRDKRPAFDRLVPSRVSRIWRPYTRSCGHTSNRSRFSINRP